LPLTYKSTALALIVFFNLFTLKEQEMTVVLNTSGDGYWSSVINAQIRITDMKLGYVNDELDFGELRVYFDTESWDVNKHGLIYTDSLFMRQLREFLDSHRLVGKDVSYSEQGMQGNNYVSCDIGKKFLDSWSKKFGTNLEQLLRQQELDFAARWG
jgi:hypothetical protein